MKKGELRQRESGGGEARSREDMAGELVVWVALLLAHELLPCPGASTVGRGQFPDDFLFGTSTSAYQVRCAAQQFVVLHMCAAFSRCRNMGTNRRNSQLPDCFCILA